MFLEQEAAFLTRKYKKMHGRQKKKVKSTGKKPGNIMIKQKYKLA